MTIDAIEGKKVLIVEDNDLNMKLFTDLLEAHKIVTDQVQDGTKVVAAAQAFMPDLILMDIQLPEVSGLDVTRWLKEDEQLRHIPIIAVTAFAMKGDEEKIRQGGCEDYISKPIDVMSFIEKVKKYLTIEVNQADPQTNKEKTTKKKTKTKKEGS